MMVVMPAARSTAEGLEICKTHTITAQKRCWQLRDRGSAGVYILIEVRKMPQSHSLSRNCPNAAPIRAYPEATAEQQPSNIPIQIGELVRLE
jgi:hypothetical protein